MNLEALLSLADTIESNRVRAMVKNILENPTLSFTSVKPKITLEESPAAPRKHHLFPKGLMLHTYAVAMLAKAIAEVVERVYGIKVNRDLIIAAAILHDLFKFYQYDRDNINGGYKPRDDWYMSHDYALVAELARRGADEELIRIATEVHGIAPITTLEGLIVHLADSIDARLGEAIQSTILSKAKDVEVLMGCKQVILLIEALNKYGLRYIAELAYREPDKLREVFYQLCSEMKKIRTNE